MQKKNAEFNGNLENQDDISAWKKKKTKRNPAINKF